MMGSIEKSLIDLAADEILSLYEVSTQSNDGRPAFVTNLYLPVGTDIILFFFSSLDQINILKEY